jgi:hypothetical protein
VYKAVVLSSLLYACENLTTYSRHSRHLNHFHLGCLRKLLKIKWQDKIPDTDVLERAGMTSVYTILRKLQLRWADHVIRMTEERLSKRILYGELKNGKRSHGGQRQRFKDTLKDSLESFGINPASWESAAADPVQIVPPGAAVY